MCAHRISEDENVEGRKIREIIERECSLDERRADSEKTQISIFSVFLWRTASFSTLHLSVLHSINDAVNRWKHSRERKWRFRRMAWSLHPLPPLPPKKSVLMQTHPHFVCTTHFERFASPTLPIRQCSLDDYCVDGTRWKHEGCGFVSNSMCSPCWFMSSSENDAVLCGAAFVSDDVKITPMHFSSCLCFFLSFPCASVFGIFVSIDLSPAILSHSVVRSLHVVPALFFT